MKIVTPIGYPGGKSLALKKIIPLVPHHTEYREPFLGGGSVFLELRQIHANNSFWVNDLNSDLFSFWTMLQNDVDTLVSEIHRMYDEERVGWALHKKLKNTQPKSIIERAARYYLLNKTTFSGIVGAAGYSEASYNRLTESTINRLRNVEPFLRNVRITNLDYKEVLDEPRENVFIFLDPPYLDNTESRLYGNKGELHTSFDHRQLNEKLREAKYKWLLTYDNSPTVRKMYSQFNIIEWSLPYSVNSKSTKKHSVNELIITNYDLPKGHDLNSIFRGMR